MDSGSRMTPAGFEPATVALEPPCSSVELRGRFQRPRLNLDAGGYVIMGKRPAGVEPANLLTGSQTLYLLSYGRGSEWRESNPRHLAWKASAL